MKASELLKKLKQAGWYEIRQTGSHKIMEHPEKKNKLSVPFHKSKEVPTGTANSILKDAGLR
jgi:predicted RNA binding protein YcfA (HicA-like mRNA interferase family)